VTLSTSKNRVQIAIGDPVYMEGVFHKKVFFVNYWRGGGGLFGVCVCVCVHMYVCVCVRLFVFVEREGERERERERESE